jgi:Primase X
LTVQQQQISTSTITEIENGLDFIIKHFDPTILYFPRKIMTKKLNRQELVYSKEEVLQYFQQSEFLDCRINAFRYSSHSLEKWNPDLIFIDIDRRNGNLKDDKSFQNALSNTLKNIEEKVGGYPTVLFTGGGYHIYQPIEEIVFENYDIFNAFNTKYDLFKEFLRFSKNFLSNNKADKNSNPSLKSCLLRIPGSINSKYNNKVRIDQKWNGYTPKIGNELLQFFRRELIQKKIDEYNYCGQKQRQKKKQKYNPSYLKKVQISHYYGWIETLLEIPITDFRKNATNLILAPYLINIKKISYQESFDIVINWLKKCDSVRKLNFHQKYLAKSALNIARQKSIPPMNLETLKNRDLELYLELELYKQKVKLHC